MFGVLNLQKPLHCTSHDVVNQVRRHLQVKQVGHGGTLDPLADGVLPICVGSATRLLEYFPSDKVYRAELTFGITTMSWDAEGEVLSQTPASSLTPDQVIAMLPDFTGVISQQLPPHAAVKIKGKKLYEYTRQGIPIDLPVRQAEIYSLSQVSFTSGDFPKLTLDVHCAAGTYIRSLAKEMGDKLETGAFLSKLTRTRHGQFTLENSQPLDAFLSHPAPENALMNPADFIDLPQVLLTPENWIKIAHGMKLQAEDLQDRVRNNRLYLLTQDQRPVAIAKGESGGRLKPLKVLVSIH